MNRRILLNVLPILAIVIFLTGPWPNAAGAAEATAGAPKRVAVFAFELAGSSAAMDPTGMTAAGAAMLQGVSGTSPQDSAKLAAATEMLRGLVASRPGLVLVDLTPIAARLEEAAPLHKCNGCDTDLARAAGADLAVLGKVQKLTAVLIHIDVAVKDVAADTVLRSVSVDVQGDTEESWTRGVRWLVRNRLAEPPLGPAAP